MPVYSFDNLDDMFAAISSGTEEAKNRATPEQNAITYGDYWMREWDSGYEIIQIFGYIMTRPEIYDSPAYNDVPIDEMEWEMRSAEDNYNNGYRFGRAYSVIVPEGELGDTHVSEMTKIAKVIFDAAKENGWEL
jgi:hypothetical protein